MPLFNYAVHAVDAVDAVDAVIFTGLILTAKSWS